MNPRSKRRTSITGTPPILSRGSIRTLRCAQVGQLTHSFHTTDHPSQTERSPLVRQPCRNVTEFDARALDRHVANVGAACPLLSRPTQREWLKGRDSQPQ